MCEDGVLGLHQDDNYRELEVRKCLAKGSRSAIPLGSGHEQFVHNIIGIISGGSVISKQRNYCAQRLNLFADPLDILLFLAQNFIGIFHRLLLRNVRARAETILRLLLTRSVRDY
jgi:hypothetical protein